MNTELRKDNCLQVNVVMATPDMEVIKDIPGYKVILKAVLKSQIQQLVEQLANTTEEESIILTDSVGDGTLCHLGSDSGKMFLEQHRDIRSQFLGFCLKRHHEKKHDQDSLEADGEQAALYDSMGNRSGLTLDGMGNRSGLNPKPLPRHTLSCQQEAQPVSGSRALAGGKMRLQGNRHQPYPMTRPVRSATAPLSFDQEGDTPKQGSRPSEQGSGPSEQGPRPSEQGPRPSEQGSGPSEQWSRPSEQGSRPSEQGSGPSEQGPRPSEQGPRPSEQGSGPSEQWSRPSEQGSRPSQQEFRPSRQGSRPSDKTVPVENNRLDGQVIIIEPEDENDDRPNKSAGENATFGIDVNTNISQSSQLFSSSAKPCTSSQAQRPSTSDNDSILENDRNVVHGATGRSGGTVGKKSYKKNDVVWVKWKRWPYIPALVKQVYRSPPRKRITFAVFCPVGFEKDFYIGYDAKSVKPYCDLRKDQILAIAATLCTEDLAYFRGSCAHAEHFLMKMALEGAQSGLESTNQTSEVGSANQTPGFQSANQTPANYRPALGLTTPTFVTAANQK